MAHDPYREVGMDPLFNGSGSAPKAQASATTGPWCIYEQSPINGLDVSGLKSIGHLRTPMRSGPTSARVDAVVDIVAECVSEADARLIAAAPALRDALRAAERALSAANIAGQSLYAADVTLNARAALVLADTGRE